MTRTIDEMMEEASVALVRMDYLTCEALCLDALAEARRAGDWGYYARILLPLQEARRQRRIIAAEGVVALGVNAADAAARAAIESLKAGSVVLTRPSSAADARTLSACAREARRHVEVLLADNDSTAETWTIRSFAGPAVACPIAAPPRAWVGHFLAPGAVKPTADGKSPADWFIDATECLGDAALAEIPVALAPDERLSALEACLEVVSDHEIIHQRLADAARSLARA
jgi:hypothetical protein